MREEPAFARYGLARVRHPRGGTYPRRLRAWHDPPCLGSRGGCRQLGARLSLRREGRSLDNRPAGHTDRGAPVGIRNAAMGRLRPILSARFKGSQDAPSISCKASSGDAARMKVFRCRLKCFDRQAAGGLRARSTWRAGAVDPRVEAGGRGLGCRAECGLRARCRKCAGLALGQARGQGLGCPGRSGVSWTSAGA